MKKRFLRLCVVSVFALLRAHVHKLNEGRPDVSDLIRNREVALIINTPAGKLSKIDDSAIRMLAIQYKIPYMTTIAAASATAEGIKEARNGDSPLKSLQEYLGK